MRVIEDAFTCRVAVLRSGRMAESGQEFAEHLLRSDELPLMVWLTRWRRVPLVPLEGRAIQ